MTAVLSFLLLTWVGVATTGLIAPTLRPTATFAVGLGVSYAVALGVSTALLLFLGPSSLAGLPYLLGGMALAASVALARRPREATGLRIGERGWASLAVLGAALLMSLWANLVGSPAYELNTLFYLTFGSYVPGPHAPYPALWAYGNEYVLPFMQLKYALMSANRLWSAGDPLRFLHTGAPAMCVLLTVSVSLAAYEFFRTHARPIPAALLTAIWLTGCLEDRLYSVRAETVAWIPAFSFLLVLTLALRPRASRGLWLLCAALLVTTSLLHGIVFLVSACVGACVWIVALVQASSARRIGLLRSTAATAVMATVSLGIVYYGVHARHARGESKSFVEMEGDLPAAGSVDPTRRFSDLFVNRDLYETGARIREAPPAVSLEENVSIALMRPLLTPFRRWPEAHNRVALGLGLLAAAFLLVPRPESRTWDGLAFGFVTTIGFLFALSVVLNYRSYGWFPWAVVERRFLRYISTSEAMILAILIVAAAYAWASRPWKRRAVSAIVIAASCLTLAAARDRSRPRQKSRYLTPEFAEVTRYLRSEARAGDRAVATWGSMGHMQYLTGIPHDSEGVMPYEVHRLIIQNTRSLERTRQFLDEPNRKYLDDTGIRYVILTWRRRMPGVPFSHAPLSEFERLGRIVLKNDHFAVFDMGDAEAPQHPAG